MSRPSVAELRPVVHPAGVKDRRSGEHWMGRLYMREVSLRVDRYLVNTRVTPNQLTYLMTVFGVLAAPALLVPGIPGAVLGVVCVQLYLLLDCVDGEIARWKKQYSLERRLPGPGRRLPDRRGGARRLRSARRRPVGQRAHRLAVGLPRHPGRPRRDPDQGRDRPRRRRPPPGRPAAGQGGGRPSRAPPAWRWPARPPPR